MGRAIRDLVLLGLAAIAAGFSAAPCWHSSVDRCAAARVPALEANEASVEQRSPPKFRRPKPGKKPGFSTRSPRANVVKKANYHPNALKCAICNSESYTEQ